MRRLMVVLVVCSAAACDRAARADGEGTPPDSAVRDSTAQRDTIIGRDSAFGPTHTIDASGKIRPIERPRRGGDTTGHR